MIKITKQWYENVANLFEAYCLFYDKNPNFSQDIQNKKRINIEFQTMVYLIEYGLEIVLGTDKYPTYLFNFELYDSVPTSKLLKETIDFIMSDEEREKYIKGDMCTLEDNKKELIKKYGRLVCIKFGDYKLGDLEYMLKHYYLVHKRVGVSKYSIMRDEERYEKETTMESLLEPMEEEGVYHHNNNQYDGCVTTNGFVGDNELNNKKLNYLYEELRKAKLYKEKAFCLSDPFIHYAKECDTLTGLNWDKAYKELEKEETARTKILNTQNS